MDFPITTQSLCEALPHNPGHSLRHRPRRAAPSGRPKPPRSRLCGCGGARVSVLSLWNTKLCSDRGTCRARRSQGSIHGLQRRAEESAIALLAGKRQGQDRGGPITATSPQVRPRAPLPLSLARAVPVPAPAARGGCSGRADPPSAGRLPPRPAAVPPCPAPLGPAAHPGPAVAMVMAEGTAVLRRNRPGTKAQDFYNWPDESFEEMDSTLAVQQYIQQNIRADCSNIDKILEPPEGQDEGVWKYEHLRQFCLELNGLAVKLQSECHPDTCTQMTATEQWIFLCAAHKTPKECPAIDYTRHTLDGAACLLNSNKYFPSRVSIKESSVAKLGSVCRRIYRIFSHAYFHHRQIFDEYENETFLCHRFTKFVMKYNLMSKDNLIVPILEEEVQNSVSGESEA
uniref:MOB-like protein phocein n=1 Tax=Zonotrichia albicollis TaxID=44394 RepID=A0A8D2N5H8_ZONAL